MLYPITPLMLAPDANGRFIFRVVTSEPLNTGAVVLKTADKTAWAPVIDSRAMIEFGSLPEGKVGIDAFLVDTVQKTILIRNQFNFFNSKHGAPPEGAVSIDAARGELWLMANRFCLSAFMPLGCVKRMI